MKPKVELNQTMPLTRPAPRQLLHQRTVTCRGYRRDDGLLDIEGHLEDTKSYPFRNRDRGEVPAGEPVHGMWLRLTIDEELEIHDAEASTEFAPYAVCPRITPNFKRLTGLRIGAGWMREVRKRVGGVQGCTHLVELLGPIATTAFQTLAGQRKAREPKPPLTRPFFLDSCHALRSDGEVVKLHWPAYFTG
ncbi:MAG TPA: DUF2889 domain-containing protein [Gammaproteobacteria bacterium]|nr:DUF2889 domain-containing protein [Gammaproteobacteria bacterium]